jgi:hypothetical protein
MLFTGGAGEPSDTLLPGKVGARSRSGEPSRALSAGSGIRRGSLDRGSAHQPTRVYIMRMPTYGNRER